MPNVMPAVIIQLNSRGENQDEPERIVPAMRNVRVSAYQMHQNTVITVPR